MPFTFRWGDPVPDEQDVTEQDNTATVGDQEDDETSSPPETGDRPQSDGDQGEKPKKPQDSFDRDRADRTIKAIRAEKKQLESELTKIRKSLKEREDAELSASERLQRELESAREELGRTQQQIQERDQRDRTRNFRDAITAAAEKAGALRPSVLHKLVDPDDLELGDDGAPLHPGRVVDNLRRNEPWLFKGNAGKGDADAGAGKDSAAGEGSVDTWIRRAAGRPG
jgi:hypothetical protein